MVNEIFLIIVKCKESSYRRGWYFDIKLILIDLTNIKLIKLVGWKRFTKIIRIIRILCINIYN